MKVTSKYLGNGITIYRATITDHRGYEWHGSGLTEEIAKEQARTIANEFEDIMIQMELQA